MRKNSRVKRTFASVFCFVLILFYNNCGPGFKSSTDLSSLDSTANSGGSSTPTTTTLPSSGGNSTTTTIPVSGGGGNPVTTTTLPSSGGGSSTTTTLPNNSAAQIAFPPNGATSDAHIVVRGNITAGSQVSQVSVNGVQATITNSNWRADVPLQVGANNLSVNVTANGVTKTGVASVAIQRFSSDTAITRGSGNWATRILGMSYDSVNQRLVMGDDTIDGAWEMRMSDGNRRILSDSEDSPKIGGGIDLTFPTAVTTSANQCFVVDDTLIAAIDLTTGTRSLVIDTKTVGFGDLYLTPDAKSLFVLALDSESILKMNPTNGTSSVVSSSTVGSGSSLNNIAGMGISWAQNKAYTTTYYGDTILSVDLSTGVRQVFSNAASGEPKFADPRHVIVDDISGQAFVWDSKQLTAINLQTGRRKLIGNSGPLTSLTAIVTMTMTPYGPALLDYVPSYEGPFRSPTVILIDPIEGTRLILSR